MKKELLARKKKLLEWPAFVDISALKGPTPKIFIIKERCKECELCTEYCPEQILAKSDKINEKGYHFPTLKEGKTFDDCTNCGFCQLVCPELAIFVVVHEEEKEKKE